ncbi:tetratricopeptide repeat protein [Streptomyces sp. NPDC051921]|uniref:tetratricopeptide repeat protein n=1 Tax=Streptomyces sp. NPDC051921 TaxID=3155806 RepID=UPI00341C1468
MTFDRGARGGAAPWWAWASGAPAPWHRAALRAAQGLMDDGRFEEAEARARELVAERRQRRGRDRRPATVWLATFYATTAAIAHGRRPEVLAELEALIEDMAPLYRQNRDLLLSARLHRAWVLIDLGRSPEAEAEARDVLRSLARTRHLAEAWEVELWAALCLGDALCAQHRYEEAAAIARGNLPRAGRRSERGLRILLARSLSGLGRHEEALAEARRTAPEHSPGTSGERELVTAVALHGLGRPREAEEELRRALTACERYLHASHPLLGEIHSLGERIRSA